jgi:RNA polymerase-binding transcription factor DksA
MTIDAEDARELIESERARIEALVREREAEGITRESEGEQLSELASHDQHQADLGTETFEREKDFSLLEQLEAELDELDRALRKLDEGTYGICEACGEAIPPERLEALPGARFCVKDQARR